MSYSFYLGDVRLPVAPGRLDVRHGNRVRRVDLVSGDEVVFMGGKTLCEVEFTALLPYSELPFAVYTNGFKRGDTILEELLALKESGKAFRFIVHRRVAGVVPASVNIRAVFREIRVREDAEHGSDIYVDIKLVEYAEAQVRRVTSGSGGGNVSVPARSVEAKPVARSHTVVKGDSLWAISQKHLGDGNRWKEIYNLNKTAIDSRNKGTGNAYHTIYPGQVFNLP
ncbi:MAG: LysM peptidoglycan-binding domain-containing protein [Oscillospiraceae bacterium]|nr:LysM peptidoglycan-binding domain-containing protein [Oscillospiraceae bacterium]